MKAIGKDRSEAIFEDFKSAYSENQARVEASRCLYCSDAPCVEACPTSIQIPEFIRKISTGNLKGSARTIFESNILGMSCARVCPVEVLCVGACVHNEQGVPPVQIGKLQRFATDQAFDAGWRFFEAGADSGKSVALVGAGPASLAAAHELRRFGHACVIYEKREVIGGLSTTGVAPYKMRADRAFEEAQWVLSIGGIEVRTGVSVGTSLDWQELEAKHDAIFLGMGLGSDTELGVEGESLDGVEGAVAYIERLKLGTVSIARMRHALVVGGGNTAVDAVRELLGLGVPHVSLVYRGSQSGMPGYAHEWSEALREGASSAWHTTPVGFEGQSGKVVAARCIRTDESKRPIAGSEHRLEADLVLMAIGQSKLGELVAGLEGIRVEKGCVQVDADGFTGRTRYWAGGDCVNGGKEVVNAVADGKLAARAIHTFLSEARA